MKNVKTGADVASLVGAALPVKYKSVFRRIYTSRQKNVLCVKGRLFRSWCIVRGSIMLLWVNITLGTI